MSKGRSASALHCSINARLILIDVPIPHRVQRKIRPPRQDAIGQFEPEVEERREQKLAFLCARNIDRDLNPKRTLSD